MVDTCLLNELVHPGKEAPDVSGRGETNDVTGEQTAKYRTSPSRWQHHPVSRSRPRHIDRVVDHSVRRQFSHHAADEVHVVVAQDHHGRPGSCHLRASGFRCYLFCERSAHGNKALLPRDVRFSVDVRGVGESPGAVVQEPEQRVADSVVKAVVSASRGCNEPRLPAGREAACDDPVFGFADSHSICAACRGGDPR
jgi:hypothetical protein